MQMGGQACAITHQLLLGVRIWPTPGFLVILGEFNTALIIGQLVLMSQRQLRRLRSSPGGISVSGGRDKNGLCTVPPFKDHCHIDHRIHSLKKHICVDPIEPFLQRGSAGDVAAQ